MIFKYLFLLLIFSFTFTSFVDAKTVSRNKSYKAFYKTSYGRLAVDKILIKKQVKRDEFLSNIFEDNNIDFKHLISISEVPDSIFNEKRIRVGNTYAVTFKLENSQLIPKQFIYEKNKIEYIVAKLENEFSIVLKKKPITIKEKVAKGVINSSLYVSMQSQNTNPLLAVSLSEVFAWTIDFYKIQKGDFYKIIYTEQFVEGKSLNEFKIKAAIFSHYGKELEAYYYKAEDQEFGDFYDEKGGSMRHTFLKAPVKYSRISSRYSGRRFHPVQKRWKAHLGTDYAAPTGTPIFATANGVVSASRYSKYNGHYVKIKHNSMYSTQYLHMSKRAVKVGQYVTQAQVIGYVGSTGLATGPHVCYRFWKNGKQVDASKQDLPKADPIKEEYLDDYLKAIQEIRNKLINIKINNEEV